MIVKDVNEISNKLSSFKEYGCVVILCRDNGGKFSIITEMVHGYFGEERTYYITFIDQNKPNFKSRKNKLVFNEIVKDKVIVFDEIDSDEEMDVKSYLKKLIENNLVVILSNLYGSSNDYDKEIELFKKHEGNILPDNTLFVFVNSF